LSVFSLTFLVPVYPGCPGKEAVKQVSVSLSVFPQTEMMSRNQAENVLFWPHAALTCVAQAKIRPVFIALVGMCCETAWLCVVV